MRSGAIVRYFMFVITMCFEGLKEDWFCQLGHPRKTKNLLTSFSYLRIWYGHLQLRSIKSYSR